MAELVSQSVIEGTLEQVVFQSDDGVFYVLKLRRSEDGGMISVTGPFGRLIPGEVLRVHLKYTTDRRSAISGLKRVSRPGQRTYVGHGEIPKVLGGMGTAIVSTSHGVMTGHEARDAGVGGEVVAHVW